VPAEPARRTHGTIAASEGGFLFPAVIADQGNKAAERFFTFLTDQIPNVNPRAAPCEPERPDG
jgi:hypothetical protein